VKATICLVIGWLHCVYHVDGRAFEHPDDHVVPMLIGLAIDFGVHLITRYEEELRHGKTAERTDKRWYSPDRDFTAALTTAGAFLAMYSRTSRHRGNGLICGGVDGLPRPDDDDAAGDAVRGQQNVIDHHVTEDATRARIENIWLQRPVLVLGVTLGCAWRHCLGRAKSISITT